MLANNREQCNTVSLNGYDITVGPRNGRYRHVCVKRFGQEVGESRVSLDSPDLDRFSGHCLQKLSLDGEHASTLSELIERAAREVDALKFERISAAELASGDYQLDYLIDGILVDRQPCVVAGPHKSLKTTLLVDLAISLAAGVPFLRHFPVTTKCRVGLMSGESGMATIQEIANRVAKSARLELAGIDGLVFSPTLPQLGELDHMDALRRFIFDDELTVVLLDPTYLCMPVAADKGGNIFAMGELLRSANQVAHECGSTLVIAHHTKKGSPTHEPPKLADIAWSGFAEWARQWIMLNRREPYDPDSDGEHALWMSPGGSAGHSRLWGLDIREGRRDEPGGRVWEVDVVTASTVRDEQSEQRNAKQVGRERQRQAKLKGDCELVLRKLEAASPDGLTKTAIRDKCQFNTLRVSSVIEALIDDGLIVKCNLKVNNRNQNGFQLKDSNCLE